MRSLSYPDLPSVAALLAANQLDPSDLAPDDMPHFLGIEVDQRLVATGALTPIAQLGLLRSVVTAQSARGQGHANKIVRALEARAVAQNIHHVYLLTDSARNYFTGMGYQDVAREDAPPPIRATPQFEQLCPASAQVMLKVLAPQ
ncbi:MAG: GNAT family N-acetyltransferase [Gammaproteobacteria bacterium]